ncbi:uncharacterized protein LOC133528445 isoform X4 [Cydia pomonella]|uniref:uncharacterized protein LOC133528445 isoform X4 n=1 Tax=Cydia pomonella TaxID=82600 RepID=UPI002ADD66C9|nr:uncharacterized protein LOC133528445 isoform X4 [Cydia pomonella]
MVVCALNGCHNTSVNKNKPPDITFHAFPHDPTIAARWTKLVRLNRNDICWKPTKHSRICSLHFDDKSKYITSKGLVRIVKGTVPNKNISISIDSEEFFKNEEKEQYVQPLPGPNRIPTSQISDTHLSSKEPQDPLSRGTIEQCRFCSEFSKECSSVSNKPYLAINRTTLAFNDVIVQLDFNDESLPKTVCRDCDAKLQEMYHFVKDIKRAQNSLINIEKEHTTQVNIELEDTSQEFETLVVKTEYEEDTNDEKDDRHDGDYASEDNDYENKEGIVDPLTVGETVFIKEAAVTQKRKSNTASANQSKKAKVAEYETENENSEFIIDIKEEIIERCDKNDDANNTRSSVSDPGTDVKPSEVELATSALVYKMKSDETSGLS